MTAMTDEAWFSAEELGLIGSTKYVGALSQAEKDKISLFINVDMIGSPNYMIGVYDGDGSRFGQKGPEGSAIIENLFHQFYGAQTMRRSQLRESPSAVFSPVLKERKPKSRPHCLVELRVRLTMPVTTRPVTTSQTSA